MTARRTWSFLLALLIIVSAGSAAVAKLPRSGDRSGPAPAATSGSPVELPGKRTASSDTFEIADGEFETRLYEEPVNYRDADGKWAPIDQRIEASEGGFTNAAAGFSIHLPQAVGGAPVRLKVPEGWVSTRLLGATAGSPSVHGNAVSYREAGRNLTSS